MRRRTFVRSTVAAAVAAALPRRDALAGRYHLAPQDPDDLAAVRGDGGAVVLKAAALKELVSGVHGRVLFAKSEGYEQARHVLNPAIDRRPALIVQPSGTADVRSAVAFAREHSLLLAVKCGGHSFSGQSTCNGGMMLDLSPMRGVRVDPVARRAWVAGGTLLGLVDHEAAAHGLVTPLGTVSHTGVGGLTTGGGFGRLARRFGLALDNVTALDIVTANGTFRRASADENPDLFWGVRGGGGNFGVVTAFEFQLHPMRRDVVAGDLIFPIGRAAEVLRVYADYSPLAPDELYLDFFMSRPPGGGDGMVGIHACYSGPPSSAARALEPLKALGTPAADTIATTPYTVVQRSGDVTDPRAMGNYVKSGFTSLFPSELIYRIVDNFAGHPDRFTTMFTQHSGGAISRVPVSATAFAHRDAQHNLLVAVAWPAGQDAAPHMQWARDYWATLEPFTSGFYVNEVADEAADVVNANYRENYRRLVALKNRYDPTNLFRLNANVQPTT